MFVACNATKYLAEDEALHVKNTIEIDQPDSLYVTPVSKPNVASIIQPKSNPKFFGSYPGQARYLRLTQKDSLSNYQNFLLKSFSNEPILYDSTEVEISVSKLKTYLKNNGYFNSEVTSETTIDNKKSTTKYLLKPNYQHIYDSVAYQGIDSIENIKDILEGIELQKYITTGNSYNVNDFEQLRTDIAASALEKGYYRFNRGAIYIENDTLANDGKVDVYVEVKNDNDELYNQKFYIRNIFVKIGKGNAENYTQPEIYNDKQFSTSESADIKPKAIDRFLLFEKGELYSKTKHLNTINKLYDLPLVNYSTIEFSVAEEADSMVLDAFITANTRSPMSTSFEPTLSWFEGPAIQAELTFEHRNIFKGGERFGFSVSGGVESGQTGNQNTKLFGTSYFQVEPKLTFPRLLYLEKIYPNTYLNTTNQSTNLTARFGYQDRIGLYRLLETSVGQTWDWQSSPHNRHSFSLVDVSLIRSNLSPYYDQLLDQNPSTRYSFEDRLIFSTRYNYLYSNKLKRPNKNYFDFNGSVETAGQMIHLLTGNLNDTLTIGNNTVARYFKSSFDFKYYWIINPTSELVNRVYVGSTIPFGPVKSVPAVKQYFAGGSNSMRAWRLRSLGPGTYDYRDDGFDPDQLIDQRGDLKLEANVEYRFDVAKLAGQQLEGALFTDAGNIWSYDEPADGREGANISSDLLKQIGIGSGAGVRLNIQNFFTIRLDLAFKIHDPVLPENERWVKNPINLNNGNLTLGINYPF